MSRVDTAAAMDRLPWLPDELPVKSAPRHGRTIVGSVIALALLLGGGSFWFGARKAEEQRPRAVPKSATTVRLPASRPGPAAPQEINIPPPAVEPIVAPATPVMEAPPPVTKPTPERQVSQPHETVEAAPAAQEAAKPEPEALPQPWPVRVIDGAAGRLVRIGAFASVHQAKRGWWAIVKINPTLKRLPALVVPVRSLRNGRVYYRLQMGTTSQAHSAVLCQRMRMIGEPCVVIGAPGGE